jgi:hypothetical protein
MAEFTLPKDNLEMSQPNIEQRFKNVKELKLGDGSVRIKDGAMIITDETGTDRVLIGFYEDGF